MKGVKYLADSNDRAAWEAARQGGIGASDAAHILTSGAAGWASLAREKATGKLWRGNRYTRHGNEREPVIAAFAQRRYGLEPNTWLLARLDEPTHMATPDAVSLDGLTLGEFKTTVKDWPEPEDVPADYRWQMDWQMYVTGAQRVMFLFEAHENFIPIHPQPRMFIFERDESRIAEALQQVRAFQESKPSSEIPDELQTELDELLEELAPLDEHLSALKERADAIRDRIRERLTEHGEPLKYVGRAGNVTWSYPKPKATFQAAALKEADPDLYAKYLKESASTPRLTITGRN